MLQRELRLQPQHRPIRLLYARPTSRSALGARVFGQSAAISCLLMDEIKRSSGLLVPGRRSGAGGVCIRKSTPFAQAAACNRGFLPLRAGPKSSSGFCSNQCCPGANSTCVNNYDAGGSSCCESRAPLYPCLPCRRARTHSDLALFNVLEQWISMANWKVLCEVDCCTCRRAQIVRVLWRSVLPGTELRLRRQQGHQQRLCMLCVFMSCLPSGFSWAL